MKLMPIVYVTDMERSLAFYRALGFASTATSPMWSELSAGDGAVLALHHDDAPAPPSPLRVELATVATKPLEEVLGELRTAGIEPVEAIAAQRFGRSTKVRDPDGLLIQINEIDLGGVARGT